MFTAESLSPSRIGEATIRIFVQKTGSQMAQGLKETESGIWQRTMDIYQETNQTMISGSIF